MPYEGEREREKRERERERERERARERYRGRERERHRCYERRGCLFVRRRTLRTDRGKGLLPQE